MKPENRTTLGYALAGFLLGMFLLPWFYLWSVRSRTAVAQDPVWVWVYLAVVLVPALALAAMGRSRARAGPASA